MELDASRVGALHSGSVIMHVNKVHSVTTIGRAAIAEFGSAVDAVQCGVEAQTALTEANSSLAPDCPVGEPIMRIPIARRS